MRKKKAFTMVEILIVIFIFGVGILGVLDILTETLGYFESISTKTKASFLAKEGMEIAYSFRDSRIEEGLPRNYYTGECENELYLGSGDLTVFKIGFANDINNSYWTFETGPEIADFETNFKNYYLELYTGNDSTYYRYSGWTEEKLPNNGFARYVEFTPIMADGIELDKNRLVKVASHVLYKRGARTGEVILDSFIGMRDSVPADISSCL